MEKISNSAELKARVAFLELQRSQQEQALKKELQAAHEFLKPGNLIRNGVKEVIGSPEIRSSLANAALAMLVGYFSKKMVFGAAKGPLKQLLSHLLQAVVTDQVAGRAGVIRQIIADFVNGLLNKKQNPL